MKTSLTITQWLTVLAFSIISLQSATTFAQGTTAFTYQGQLHDGGTNANGAYTMIFKLYDAVSGGNQIGSTITTPATLANGLFSVNLDFGAGAFNGSARWLDITVTNGPDTQTLSPRVQVLPAPYAQFAAVAASVTNGAITASAIANGAVGSAQLASNLTVSGTLNISNSLQISGTLWNVSVGTITNPVNETVIPNCLLFSANGLPCLELAPYGPIVFCPYKIQATILHCVGGYIGVNDINGNFEVDIDSSGNISANGNINANGYIHAGGDICGATICGNSDRNLKEKFTPIDNQEILERVASLPISSWNFKTDPTIRHVGPMAQDFYAAFNVGPDDKHIATVDEGGVALAAIQGLNEKLKEKDARIEALEKRLADLEQLVKTSTQK